MDWTTIIVAIITFLGSLIGTFSGFKLTSYRVEQLEKKVEKHNSLIERTYALEKRSSLLEERLSALSDRIETVA